MKASATFETDQASRYMHALCEHLGRKLDVTATALDACIAFPFGQCELAANERQLELTAHAQSESGLKDIIEIMTRHVERFAFREHPLLDWHPAAAIDPDQ